MKRSMETASGSEGSRSQDRGSQDRGSNPDSGKMVCVGVVSGAHGIQGQVRIKSFTAEPADIARYGRVYDAGGATPLRLTVTGRSREMVIARIEGIADRDAAEALRGHQLFVSRALFPPLAAEEFYHTDLIGLRAELAAGPDHARRPLGSVVAVHDFGGGDVIEVASEQGGSMMVPFTRDAVPEVNVAEGWLAIAPLPGLMDAGPPADDDAAADGERPSP